MSAPFLIFPWNTPFLPALKQYLDMHCPDAVPTLLTPNFRPWKYLQTLYTAGKKPRVLPRVLPFQDALELWHAAVDKSMPELASGLDQVWLLHGAAAALPPAEDPETGKAVDILGGMSLDDFYPWGQHIASLIEEMLMNGIKPQDIPACGDEVPKSAVLLLENLGQMHAAYLAALEARHLTTPGLRVRDILASLDEGRGLPAFLTPSADRPVFILAGASMSNIERRIYEELWKNGAVICLHTDPALADQTATPHWSARRQAAWAAEWHAGIRLVETDVPARPSETPIRFFAGYDLHSQLLELQADLAQREPDQNVAVVLPSSAMLMPVLHHIPAEQRPCLNIAMGFPITETGTARLLEACLALQDKRDSEGRCHWRELLRLADTSVLSALQGPDGESLQPALLRFRTQLLHGRRFVDPVRDVLTGEYFQDRESEVEALTQLLRVLVDGFSGLHTLGDLADALQRLCDHFRERGDALRQASPLDMEALYHVEHSMIPMLRHCLMATETLSLATLTRVFTQILRRETIAFEPGPSLDKAGVQLLVLQETSLLDFDAVYLPEATDDMLPGPRHHDPLLPESLRAVIGLPPLETRDHDIAYAVRRLIACSGSAKLYWQEVVIRSHLFDGKKTRSRFAEEAIWQKEQAAGRVLVPGREPGAVYTQAECRLTPMAPLRSGLTLEGSMLAELRKVLAEGPLSPSFLDDYIKCPMLFGFKRLARLKEMKTMTEGDDYPGVGTLVHKVLQTYHERHLGEQPGDRDKAANELIAIFNCELSDPGCLLNATLPPESLAFLQEVTPGKLRKYIENQPDDSCPVKLEADLEGTIEIAGQTFRLKGRTDRMDLRGSTHDRLVVLDYKTGSKLPTVNARLWNDDAFFSGVETLIHAPDMASLDWDTVNALFKTLTDNTASVQLAAYVTMGMQSEEGHIADAAFVELAKEGREVSFFKTGSRKSPEKIEEDKEKALLRCPDIVAIVLMHMARTERLEQRKDTQICKNCPYQRLCQV